MEAGKREGGRDEELREGKREEWMEVMYIQVTALISAVYKLPL